MLSVPEYKFKYFGSRKEAEEYLDKLASHGYASKLRMKRHNLWEVKTKEKDF